MKEKTRQQLLASGQGITLKQALELINTSHSESWSGCLSGSGWTGRRVYLRGQLLTSGEHQQNDSPTGWERRGHFSHYGQDVSLKRGDTIKVIRNLRHGRNLDGDWMYRRTEQTLKIV